MYLSAEIRYWWSDEVPGDVRSWFHDMRVPPGGGGERSDVYLLDPAQTELGIKLRGGKPGAEIKGLVMIQPTLATRPFAGRVEIWSKWTSTNLRLDERRTITTHKTRWLRKYDTGAATVREIPLGKDEKPVDGAALPDDGCSVELTRVLIDGRKGEWWTLGFEAFGGIDTVRESLRRTLEHLGTTSPPAIGNAAEGSYPAWLGRTSVTH